MNTMAANMATSVTYTSKERGKASLDFDFKLSDIDLSKLTDLFPVIDSLLPMSESFEGKVNFTEALGEVTLLYFDKVGDNDAVIGKLPGIHADLRGQTVRMSAAPEKVQVFVNGKSLYYR